MSVVQLNFEKCVVCSSGLLLSVWVMNILVRKKNLVSADILNPSAGKRVFPEFNNVNGAQAGQSC